MVQLDVQILLAVGVVVGMAGVTWVYQDARSRGIESADIWAMAFFAGFVLVPVIGGVAVLVFYRRKRPRSDGPTQSQSPD
ncbi:hypothetical protein G6M89_00225 [Natronolimnobius sp. AArcel1]|uniref:hypothetical protein n=1 Tax=Natronolimnobius sp. AArcel1 TaxID=1679093 RepID=UPI0013ED6592|nr:hypothetical protein [Natronolimnobius sp. AArcel1]NGM67445.1 hypothetical protein [Natronolimnobius sp. AArcel1]